MGIGVEMDWEGPTLKESQTDRLSQTYTDTKKGFYLGPIQTDTASRS